MQRPALASSYSTSPLQRTPIKRCNSPRCSTAAAMRRLTRAAIMEPAWMGGASVATPSYAAHLASVMPYGCVSI